ncbi:MULTISPECIES: ComEC/Rec2 family competence protein [unclassified Paenibacillus]|uniref:ComEC/Rec2 family competence protein n=1 Tax=unclassified Paenibacillus TaxID=185978 RepID=UPI000410DC61|nr:MULTISPECIES: ComEC/Rec2 family competence protein [unclassified Paenibacillus]
MKGRPLLVFTVCWLCGSGMACALSGWSLLVGMIGALVCLPLLLRMIDIRGWSILLLIGALIGGAVHWEWNDTRNRSSLPEITHTAAEDLDGYAATFEGTLMSDVRIDGDRADFEMQITSMLPQSDTTLAPASEARTEPNLRERLMVQVRLAEEEEQQVAAGWKRGDTITLTGALALPGEARNFGGFDYRNYLRTLHIHWLFKVKGASSVTNIPPEGLGKLNILRWNDVVRHKLGAAVEQLFPEPHAGYMKGLIIGMSKDIDPDTYGQFSQLGLTHILAISGTHVAVYVASLLLLLSWLRLTRETSLTIVLLLIPAYVLLSGGSPSVIRAGIMSMIGLYMARRGLARDGLQMISAAALLMMWWNPYFLLSVSFQLSFLVTAGLMIYMPLINRLFSSWPKGLAATASVTVTAQLISFPVTILYFNQFSLLSFVANFLLVSLISAIVLPLGTVALILSLLWMPLAKPLAWIAILLNKMTFASTEWMNSLPGFVLIWATPSLLWIAAYYAVLYALLRTLHRGSGEQPIAQGSEEDTAPLVHRHAGGSSRAALGLSALSNVSSHGLNKDGREANHGSMTTLSASIAWPEYSSAFAARGAGFYSGERMNIFHKWMCALLAISFVAGLWWAYQTPQPAGAGVVQFLDIGQGDSTLITTPGGKHILVDGGGTVQFGKSEQSWKTRRDPYEVGAKVVVPLLKKRGIHRLDAVIVTHADQDHAGGLQAVLEQIPVKRFMFNGTTSGTANFEKLLDTAIEKKIPLYAIRQGMSYAPDGETRLHFIYPDLEKTMDTGERLPVSEHQNHDSVVFMLEMAGASLLFTGDMDAAAEQDLLYMIQDGSLAASFVQQDADAALADVSVQEMFTRQAGENHEDAPVTIDVLKVAHHGSKTSSTEAWLQYWNASASVISAGANNTYGHPNPGVLERLVDSGTDIYRTDQMGEIQMRIKDGDIDVRYKLVPNSP